MIIIVFSKAITCPDPWELFFIWIACPHLLRKNLALKIIHLCELIFMLDTLLPQIKLRDFNTILTILGLLWI